MLEVPALVFQGSECFSPNLCKICLGAGRRKSPSPVCPFALPAPWLTQLWSCSPTPVQQIHSRSTRTVFLHPICRLHVHMQFKAIFPSAFNKLCCSHAHFLPLAEVFLENICKLFMGSYCELFAQFWPCVTEEQAVTCRDPGVSTQSSAHTEQWSR